MLGTPHYMAPEQARGEVARLDWRADVYSLGATFYQLLTGKLPIPGENGLEVLNKAVTMEPLPPRAIDPQIPRDLEAIVLKCLEKDRSARYDSVLALIEDLDRFLAGERKEHLEATRLSFMQRIDSKPKPPGSGDPPGSHQQEFERLYRGLAVEASRGQGVEGRARTHADDHGALRLEAVAHAHRIAPGSAEPLLLEAHLHQRAAEYQVGQEQRARELAEESLTLKPKSSRAQCELGHDFAPGGWQPCHSSRS